MQYEYILKGLDCPHCSAEIENQVRKLPGVRSAAINLMRQQLTVTTEGEENLTQAIIRIVRSHEPDVKVIPQSAAVTRTLKLEGLDCPHCAGVIQDKVSKLDYVISAEVNLMKQSLEVELRSSGEPQLLADVTAIVHAHEPDVAVKPWEPVQAAPDPETKKSRNMILRLIVGGMLFVIGILLSWLTVLPQAAVLAVLILAYTVLGADVVLKALRNIVKGHVFDENFLMSLSSIGAFCIGEHLEAVAVMLFYQVGEFFQARAVQRSRRSIAQLMDIRPDSAQVLRHGQVLTVDPQAVAVGELIQVNPGQRIPLDGTVLMGQSSLDTRALTGESVPRTVRPGDEALSGCINMTGVLTIQVTKPYGESTVAKIIDLVENASSRKAPTENFITAFARYYTPAVVIFAALLAVLPPLLLGQPWADWIHRGFVFLVISCPCALVISIPLTFFGGIGAASRHGILIKGSNYLEALNKVDTVVFDKTGTLTKGVFQVAEVFCADGVSEALVLERAAQAEVYSGHPIARSILAAYGKPVDTTALHDYQEHPGHGVQVRAAGTTILAGNHTLLENAGIFAPECQQAGSLVYVAADGQYLGCILIRDEIKADSAQAIADLKVMGIRKAVMLTGDSQAIAQTVALQLGLDAYHAQLLPQDKVAILEQLDQEKAAGMKLVFVGDGINDAPVLARADIGIAMGGLGSDAAIEAADVVLMTDEPGKLRDAISIARSTRRIVVQNIVLALGIKFAFLILGAVGLAGMWEAVFADVGVALLAVLNAMRMLKK